MFFSLYLIDEHQRRLGRKTESGQEPFIIYSNEFQTLKKYLGGKEIPHQCEIIDGSLYSLEDADIQLVEKPDNGLRIILKPGSGLPPSFQNI